MNSPSSSRLGLYMHLVSFSCADALNWRIDAGGVTWRRDVRDDDAKDEVRAGRRKSQTGAVEMARREASWTNALLAGAAALWRKQLLNLCDAIFGLCLI